MGAVMGSKNLKGLLRPRPRARAGRRPRRDQEAHPPVPGEGAVARGLQQQPGHHRRPGIAERRRLAADVQLPRRLLRGGREHHRRDAQDTLLVGRESCYACHNKCKRVVEAHGEYEVDPTYGGPEYETGSSLGSLVGVSDLAALCKANEICNAYTAGHHRHRRLHRLGHGVLRERPADAGGHRRPGPPLRRWRHAGQADADDRRPPGLRRPAGRGRPAAPPRRSAAAASATPCTSRARSCPCTSRAPST